MPKRSGASRYKAARSHPLDDALLLVAAAHSSAPRSEAIVRSATSSRHSVGESLPAPVAGSRLRGMTNDNRMVRRDITGR